MPREVSERGISVIVEQDMAHRLALIDHRLYNDGTREKLEVNRRGRVIPHYPFRTSNDPKAWGVEAYNVARVHPRGGKATGSKRGRR